MSSFPRRDAVVVGSGPNGLAAAVTLARAGLDVEVIEAADTIGGGTRTLELTAPGYRHDVCSAVHPLALASEFFRQFGLAERIDLRVPEVSFAQPITPGRSAIAYRDLARTVEALGSDGRAYERVIGPLARRAEQVAEFIGSPLVPLPRHLPTAVLFGLRALAQGSPLWNLGFSGEDAPALITGVAAHAIMPLPSLATAGAGLSLLAHAHAGGWPVPYGGSQTIADALADDLRAHGGTIMTGVEVTALGELPPATATLFDVTPRALVRIAGAQLPGRYRRALTRFRYGNAVAKVDFALSGPVPWLDPALAAAPTLHLGGTRPEVRAAENTVARGQHAKHPYVLVSQPGVLDDSRAPAGHEVLWTYAHVPAGSTIDQTEVVIAEIERYAPGFRDVIVHTSSATALDEQRRNPNYPGGDIAAGMPSMRQLVARPVLARDPWRTPTPGLYLTGASTVPGPGVHGLSGWYAAQSALRHEFGITAPVDLAP
ncbi:NAD(P)/FAD-dependent oxidoreductase [uncultured Microbacterium sp.]|uniref:phytoene desaturase family protein n=1 Tax=uncultured Microbacterium sp. TaxID=191216 RepID=UPI0025D8B2DB|nr:NAD(P)/FAD-dependent oxidoreductase [uncultured Microbacterium sp.]